MARLTKPCQTAAKNEKPGMPPVYHRLYSLLHTLQAMEGSRDRVCTLLAEIQQTGEPSASVRSELEDLLHELPVELLREEVGAVWESIEVSSRRKADEPAA
jgi:hypothetical protein